jgi:hypothetical protein
MVLRPHGVAPAPHFVIRVPAPAHAVPRTNTVRIIIINPTVVRVPNSALALRPVRLPHCPIVCSHRIIIVIFLCPINVIVIIISLLHELLRSITVQQCYPSPAYAVYHFLIN